MIFTFYQQKKKTEYDNLLANLINRIFLVFITKITLKHKNHQTSIYPNLTL